PGTTAPPVIIAARLDGTVLTLRRNSTTLTLTRSGTQPDFLTPTPSPTSTAPGATPFSLYTHCGINETRIGSTYYVADTPLSDGNGNPPSGWGNPYQVGTITLPSPSVAIFRDNHGHTVTFHARPGATSFLHICS
ncbi:MAG: hypothetical protein ACRDU4_22415, partial [Mycobacterium sp.]